MRIFRRSLIAATIAIITMSTYASENHIARVDANGNIIQNFNLVQEAGEVTAVVTKQPTEDTAYIDTETFTGQDAIAVLGERVNTIAKTMGNDTKYFKHQLLTDPTVRVDKDGNVIIIEPVDKQSINDMQQAGAMVSSTTALSNATVPADVFALHSRPGALKRIYLNFKGLSTVNDGWGTGTAKPYSVDADNTTFNTTERANIYQIWAQVSNDYAPFDVDVTTEQPTQDQIDRTSSTDNEYGAIAVITSSAPADFTGIGNKLLGGLAYVSAFDQVNPTVGTAVYSYAYHRLAMVFASTGLCNCTNPIGEASSHEVGHTLGLWHHGVVVNGVASAYYQGHGDSTTGWAPIMGASYYKPMTQWSNGSYPGASNPNQSDLNVINARLAYVPDLESDTAAGSATLTAGTMVKGVLNSAADVDMFNFVLTTAATVNITATDFLNPNLAINGDADLKVTVTDYFGNVVASYSNEASFNGVFTTPQLSAGQYYIKIEADGRNSSGTDYGYPSYDSISDYQLTVNYTPVVVVTPPPVLVPPVAKIEVSAPTLMISAIEHISGLNSTAGSSAITYSWSLGDGYKTNMPDYNYTFKKSGLIPVQLTVTNGDNLTSTASTAVRVYSQTGPSYHTTAIQILASGAAVTPVARVNVVDQTNKQYSNTIIHGRFTGTYREYLGGPALDIGTKYPNEVLVNGATNGISTFTAPTSINTAGGASISFTVTGIESKDPTYFYDAAKNLATTKTLVK